MANGLIQNRDNNLTGSPQSPLQQLNAGVHSNFAIFTVRNSSCGKVILSQVSVCPGGGVHPLGRHPPGKHPRADTPPGRHPLGRHPRLGRHPPGQTPPADTPHPPRWPLQQTVHILLECILVFQYEDKRIQEFTEPDYQKLIALKEEDRKYSEEWLAFKESNK